MKRYWFIIWFVSLSAWCAALPKHIVPKVTVKAFQKTYLSESMGLKEIISSNELKSFGGLSLSQILAQRGSGINMHDTTGSNSQVLISMRGFGANASSNTLVLLNGVPLTNPDIAPPDLNAIPIESIQSIEIISGSEGVLYGDQAVGGVINIIEKQAASPRFLLQCAAGSFNNKSCDFYFSHIFKAIHYDFNLKKIHTDNYRDHNAYDDERLFGNIHFDTKAHHLAIHYQIMQENIQYPGALSQNAVRTNRRQAANQIDFFKNNNELLQAQSLSPFNSNWSFQQNMMIRNMSGHGVLFSPFSQSRNIAFLKFQTKGRTPYGLFKNGVDAELDYYDLNTNFGLTKERAEKASVFGTWNKKLARRLHCSLGVRMAGLSSNLNSATQIHTFNSAWANHIGLSYDVSNFFKIFLRRAQSFRFPKADENAFLANTVKNLKTQRGVSYEAGITKKFPHSNLKIGCYLLNLRNEIAFDPLQTPEQPFGSNQNLPPTRRYGIFIRNEFEINKKIQATISYDYVNARFRNGMNAGKRIPLVSEQLAQVNLKYQINQAWHFMINGLLTGNQYIANDNQNNFSPLGAYTLFNASLHYHLKNLDLSLQCQNIFNKKYYLYAGLQSGQEFFYPAPERTVLMFVRYRFF